MKKRCLSWNTSESRSQQQTERDVRSLVTSFPLFFCLCFFLLLFIFFLSSSRLISFLPLIHSHLLFSSILPLTLSVFLPFFSLISFSTPCGSPLLSLFIFLPFMLISLIFPSFILSFLAFPTFLFLPFLFLRFPFPSFLFFLCYSAFVFPSMIASLSSSSSSFTYSSFFYIFFTSLTYSSLPSPPISLLPHCTHFTHAPHPNILHSRIYTSPPCPLSSIRPPFNHPTQCIPSHPHPHRRTPTHTHKPTHIHGKRKLFQFILYLSYLLVRW